MTSEFVERIRFLAAGQDDPHSVELDAAADRIEQLESALQKIAWISTPDHEEARYKAEEIALAALKEGKDEQ